jgi:multidrug resistance efflux pump
MLQRLRKGATPEELEAGTQAAAAKEAASAAVKAGDKAIQNLREELTVRKAELRQAEAQLRGADVRQVDVQLAQEKVKAAKAALERAQSDVAAQRAALTIRSPVTGTVIRVFNRVGDTCRKGIDVFQVTDDAKGRWISAFVREKDAFYIEPGQRAKVKLASGEKVNAEVEEVGGATSSLDRQRANPLGESEQLGPELVHIRLKPLEPLKSDPIPGMSARATIRIR